MINTYYELKAVSKDGEKLTLTFIDLDLMLDAARSAKKKGMTTECSNYGYQIIRKESDYESILNHYA